LQIKHYADEKALEDRISVPYIHAIVRTKCPAIYLRNPKYLVKIKSKIDPEALKISLRNLPIMQATMNYLPDEIGMKHEMKKARLDLVGFGKAVVKVGFEFELDQEQEEPQGLIQKGIKAVKNLIKPEEKPEPKVMVDRFFVKRVGYPNGDFIIDPESTDGLRGARWCAEKFTRPLSEVKSDKYLENTSELTANVKIKEELEDKKDGIEEERISGYYYWEKNRYGKVDKLEIVVPDQDKTLKSTTNPYDHKDWPYEEADNNIIPDYLFPVGDIEPIVSQQEELDRAESMLFKHMKTFKQKYKTTEGNLKSKGKSALESPEHTLVECKEPNSLMPLENPSINSTVPLSIQTIKDDMNRIDGVTDFMMAAMPTGQRTLGEGQLAESGARQRGDESVQEMEDFMKRIGRKIMQVVQQYSTDEMLFQISGAGKNETDWINITPERNAGEYDLDVEPYSTAPIDKDKIANRALLLYKTFSADPNIPQEAMASLRKSIALVFDDVINDPDTFSKLPPPVVPPGMPTDKPGIMDESGNIMSGEEVDMRNEGAVPIPEIGGQ